MEQGPVSGSGSYRVAVDRVPDDGGSRGDTAALDIDLNGRGR